MKRVSFVTLGCKVNQYDTNAVKELLPEGEFTVVPLTGKADCCVINTCTVTHKADAEARNYIQRARRSNPNGVVIVTGCYAQVSPEELEAESAVDYVIGNSDKHAVAELIMSGTRRKKPVVIVSDVFKRTEFESPGIHRFADRTRAFLKVQDGCNYRCSFCIIPYARGRSRSLPVPEVITRARTLARSGYREIVLTGVHLASYGRDIGTSLSHLITELDRAAPVPRLRLSSLDPADMTDGFIDLAASTETLCHSFHVSLQSGDREVLRAMRRRYKPEDFMRCTDRIRERMPDASIGTDIMVAFPGETHEQFESSYRLLERSELTYFHVFPYSRRKGTPAAGMPDAVDPQTSKARSEAVRGLGRAKKEGFYRGYIGKTLPVLVEGRGKGTTPNYITVKIQDPGPSIGSEVDVVIRGVSNETALASVVY